MNKYFLFTMIIAFHFTVSKTYSQCTATTNFPTGIISVSQFNNVQQISSTMKPGNYFVANNFALGQTYQFTSSGVLDYITLRRNDDPAIVLAHGPVPFSYTVPNSIGPDVFQIHLHFTASCSSLNVNRTVNIQCTTCPAEPSKVGIATTTPVAVLEIAGKVKIGDDALSAQAGTIRWNNNANDLEVYNGTKWISLTKSNTKTWGETPPISKVNENNKLIASDGADSANFGYSVSTSGDYVIIGAYNDDVGANADQGSAYIFKRNGTNWTQEAKLTASDGTASDYFGTSVSISGDYAIIGAINDIGANTEQGSAYIFKRSGTNWSQETKLIASDGAAFDNFGYSVSIAGDYAIIGAFGVDVGANIAQGSAYVFKRSGTSWTQESKLSASDGAASDYFGISVSISGNYVIIGVYNDDIGANANQGSAYIFKRIGTNWTQEEKLIASDGAVSDNFGYSVSISDDYAIIGVYNDDIGANANQGSAYIFKRSGTNWTQESKLLASDGAASDFFGYSVSIKGDYAIIGASTEDDETTTDQGSAYIFKRSGTSWTQEAKLIALDGKSSDNFGISVSISGDSAIIGALGDDLGTNSDQGSAYIFVKN